MSFPFVLCFDLKFSMSPPPNWKSTKKGCHVLIGGIIMFVVLWKGRKKKKKSSRGVSLSCISIFSLCSLFFFLAKMRVKGYSILRSEIQNDSLVQLHNGKVFTRYSIFHSDCFACATRHRSSLGSALLEFVMIFTVLLLILTWLLLALTRGSHLRKGALVSGDHQVRQRSGSPVSHPGFPRVR